MTDTSTVPLYVVCWAYRGTAATAFCGKTLSTHDEAERLAREDDKKCPLLYHWAAPAPDAQP